MTNMIAMISEQTMSSQEIADLVESSRILGHERKDVFDQNYGTVRAYHRDAWFRAYNIDI